MALDPDPVLMHKILLAALLAWTVAAVWQIHAIDPRDVAFVLNYLPGAR